MSHATQPDEQLRQAAKSTGVLLDDRSVSLAVTHVESLSAAGVLIDDWFAGDR